MKKMKKCFLLSVLCCLLCGDYLPALQPEFSITEDLRLELNLLQSKKLHLRHSYNQILTQYQNETQNFSSSTENSAINSKTLPPPEQNSRESSATLEDLLNLGDNLFGTLDNQLAELQEQLTNSETTISGLQALLLQANETITQLSQNLTKAEDWSNQIEARLAKSSEDLAAANAHLDRLEEQHIAWKREAERLQKDAERNGFIAFAFGAVGLGVGAPLFIEGIRTDNQAMLWTAAGTIAGTSGIWLLGHYLFKCW
jgi:DNA repair exonuclease SbcCD ATPase subunit